MISTPRYLRNCVSRQITALCRLCSQVKNFLLIALQYNDDQRRREERGAKVNEAKVKGSQKCY